MNLDFHYYGTYCAALLAGYASLEAKKIAYYAQFVDECSKTFLEDHNLDQRAATVQSSMELFKSMAPRAYTVDEIHEVTGMWSSFHFLPGNFNNEIKYEGKNDSPELRQEFKLLCLPNSDLLVQTVEKAKDAPNAAKTGMTMHILADTWAHCWFAGTPTKHVNDAYGDVYEKVANQQNKLTFTWDPFPDNLEHGRYSCGAWAPREKGLMYLGHSRMGHLPDYGFMEYKYMPAWVDGWMVKDNKKYYLWAFRQMIYAMQYIRGVSGDDHFFYDKYAELNAVQKERAERIIGRRQLDASDDWSCWGHDLSGVELPKFELETCVEEYRNAVNKNETTLHDFLTAAVAHKDMVKRVAQAKGSTLFG